VPADRAKGPGGEGNGGRRDDTGLFDDSGDRPKLPLPGLQWHERDLGKRLTAAERQLARSGDPAERVTTLLSMADTHERLGQLQAALGRRLVTRDDGAERLRFGALEAARHLRGEALRTAETLPDQPSLRAKAHGAVALDRALSLDWNAAALSLQNADILYKLASTAGAADANHERVDLYRRYAEVLLDQGRIDDARDLALRTRDDEGKHGRLTTADRVSLERVEALANLRDRSPWGREADRSERRLSQWVDWCLQEGLPDAAAENCLLLGEYWLEALHRYPDPDVRRRFALACFDEAISAGEAARGTRLAGLARWNYAATGLAGEWGPAGPPPEILEVITHGTDWQAHLAGALILLDQAGAPEARLLADTRHDKHPARPPMPLSRFADAASPGSGEAGGRGG
jgi:hypothetical protein